MIAKKLSVDGTRRAETFPIKLMPKSIVSPNVSWRFVLNQSFARLLDERFGSLNEIRNGRIDLQKDQRREKDDVKKNEPYQAMV